MELYKQHQSDLPPDVFPTPPAYMEYRDNPKQSIPTRHQADKEEPSSQNQDYFLSFNQYPMHMICPFCREQITTLVSYHFSTQQYVCFFILCICFCWPCSLIPCLVCDIIVKHYCPSCGNYLGTCC